MVENKKFRMLAEFVAKEETPHWGISITKSVHFMDDVSKVWKKHGFDVYAVWQKKEVIDYKPTNKTYRIEKVSDIADLTSEQFEMFVDDLRQWCEFKKIHKQAKEMGVNVAPITHFDWVDDWLNESRGTIEIKSTNKL